MLEVMVDIVRSARTCRTTWALLVACAPISSCAQDVVLGEHIPLATTTGVASGAESTTGPWETTISSGESSSSDTAPSFTKDGRWPDDEMDGGRFFGGRDGGPHWPPRPDELPPGSDPRPAHSDPSFPFDPPPADSVQPPPSEF